MAAKQSKQAPPPPPSKSVLAVYRHEPNDPQGNQKRSSQALSRMMEHVVQQNAAPAASPGSKKPSSPSAE
jgi:hypothetical protein